MHCTRRFVVNHAEAGARIGRVGEPATLVGQMSAPATIAAPHVRLVLVAAVVDGGKTHRGFALQRQVESPPDVGAVALHVAHEAAFLIVGG